MLKIDAPPKKINKRPTVQEKMLKFTSHQDANQNHNEMSLHTQDGYQGAYYLKQAGKQINKQNQQVLLTMCKNWNTHVLLIGM